MRRPRNDDRESAGFELVGLLCALIATAAAFFIYSGDTDEIARVRFIDPVHTVAPAGGPADSGTTSSIPATAARLPATAPTPVERPPRPAAGR